MDIRNYIESGIIESYVLGLASVEEKTEVEQMAAEHTEIKQAILDFELLFEKQAGKDVLYPPAFIKPNIESILSPEFSTAVVKQIPHYKNETTIVRTISSLKYIAAAAIVLLVISTGLNFYFYSAFKNSNNKYEALFTERNTLEANNADYKTRLDSINRNAEILKTNNQNYKNQVADIEQSFKVMHNPDVKEIRLKGILDKSNFATVFWNTQTREVYFFRNHLKETPVGKQYQLWAIVKGKPVSAGVIDICNGLCKMKIIPDAQAFAVTIEKEGGSITPTLTTMTVLGKV